MRRRSRVTLALAGLGAMAAATLTAASSATADAAQGRCRKPPVDVTILPGPVDADGPTELTVTDAVARRVPIVPDRDTDAVGDPDALEKLRDEAARTDLALFTMYLADFRVPRKELAGFGFGAVSAPDAKTVAAVTIVPTETRGFRAGDRAEIAPFEYDATTTFAPLGLVVNHSGTPSTYAYDGVEGGVKIRKLTDKAICLDIDLAFTRDEETVASAVGAVKAPIVRAPRSFFYT